MAKITPKAINGANTNHCKPAAAKILPPITQQPPKMTIFKPPISGFSLCVNEVSYFF